MTGECTVCGKPLPFLNLTTVGDGGDCLEYHEALSDDDAADTSNVPSKLSASNSKSNGILLQSDNAFDLSVPYRRWVA